MPPIRCVIIATALLAASMPASAQDPDAAAKALIARYVATYDVDKLLKVPAIRAEFQAVTGNQLRAVEAALNVNGGVEYIGGALAVSGNAPRPGVRPRRSSASSRLAPPRASTRRCCATARSACSRAKSAGTF